MLPPGTAVKREVGVAHVKLFALDAETVAVVVTPVTVAVAVEEQPFAVTTTS